MKRIVCLLVVFALLVPLFSGCSAHRQQPVTFYYLRNDYQTDMNGLIASEQRDASGPRDNLKYLLTVYLMGPVDKKLRSPLPRNTMLIALHQDGEKLSIELWDTSAALSDSEFSVACACLSLTCIQLAPVTEVTIKSGDRVLTLREDTITLNDSVRPEEGNS